MESLQLSGQISLLLPLPTPGDPAGAIKRQLAIEEYMSVLQWSRGYVGCISYHEGRREGCLTINMTCLRSGHYWDTQHIPWPKRNADDEHQAKTDCPAEDWEGHNCNLHGNIRASLTPFTISQFGLNLHWWLIYHSMTGKDTGIEKKTLHDLETWLHVIPCDISPETTI